MSMVEAGLTAGPGVPGGPGGPGSPSPPLGPGGPWKNIIKDIYILVTETIKVMTTRATLSMKTDM